MTEKELLYVEDAVNHELYMIEVCKEVSDCLTDKELTKVVNKLKKQHETMLKTFMDLL